MLGPLVKRREVKDSTERNKTTGTTPVAAAAAAVATATTTKRTPAEEASSKVFPQRRRSILKFKGSICWLSIALGTACILARPSFFMGNAAAAAAARSVPMLTSGSPLEFPTPRPGPSPLLSPRRGQTPATAGKASISEGQGTGYASAAISSESNKRENGNSLGASTSSRGIRTSIAKSARVWNQERPRLGSIHGRGTPPPRLDAVWEQQEKDHFGLPPAPAPPPLPPPRPLTPVHTGERGSLFSLPSGGGETVSRAPLAFDEHDVGIAGTEIVGEPDAFAAAAAAAGDVPATASQSPTRPSPFLDVVSASGGGISLLPSKSGRPWREAGGNGFEGGRELEGEAGELEGAALRAGVATKRAGDGDHAFPARREEVRVGPGGIRATWRPHSHDSNGGVVLTLEAAAEGELTSWGTSPRRRSENREDHRRRGGSTISQTTVLSVDTEAGVDRKWSQAGDASTDAQRTLVAARDYLPLTTAALEAGDDVLQSPVHKARAPRRSIDRGRMFLRGGRESSFPATIAEVPPKQRGAPNGRENWETGISRRSGMYYEGDGVRGKMRYRVTGMAARGGREQEEEIAAAAGTEENRMASEWGGTVNNAFEGSGAPGDRRAQGLSYSRRGRSGREMREGGVGGRRKLLSEEDVGDSTCELDASSGLSEDDPLIFEPAQGDVLERGSLTNISWISALFENGASGSFTGDDDTDGFDTGDTQSLVVDKVNITLLKGNDTVRTYYDINNTDDSTYSWTVPSDVKQGESYRIAVWEAKKNICGISYSFGISSPLSLNVTSFESFHNVDNASAISDEGTGDASEILSCGAVEVTWNFTGLVKFVDVRICLDIPSYGDMAGLEDESPSSTQEDPTFVCLGPISNTPANASRLNTTLDGSEPACGVYGESFFAQVSNSESWGADMVDESERVPVLGGVFRRPNGTNVDDDAWNIYDSQEIVWEGLSGAGDEASVDIFLMRRGNSSEPSEKFIVVEGDRRDPTEGVFVWDDPSSVFPEDDLDSSNIVTEIYFLELHIAGGGGLLCRSDDFGLRADSGGGGWEFQFLLVLLTPAGLLLLCCLVIFFVACPYYDKIVRQRRRAMASSLIDIDDTYIIDGEGQPAILALGAQVIPLAHAHPWPGDADESTASMRRVSSGSASSGPWGRAVRAMGQSVTGSVGRTGGYATAGSGGVVFGIGGVGSVVGGGSNGSASGGMITTRNGSAGEIRGFGRGEGKDGGGGVDDSSTRFASAAMGDYAAGSSVSSYRGMRSGATWAFGGGIPGGSIGRRSGDGGRRDGGGVYPTAAAALGLGTAVNLDVEERSEAAIASVGSVSPSAASGAGGAAASSGTRQFQSAEGQTASSTVDRASRTGVAGSSTSYSSGRSAGASSGMTGGVDNGTGIGAGHFSTSAAVAPQGGSSFLGLDGDGGGGDVGGEGSNNASSSWNSVSSSRVDMGGLLGRGDSEGGLGGGGGVGGVVERDGGDAGVQGGGAGWLGRLGGGGGSERERIMPVVMTRIVATQVEIVEVSRAVVIDVNGVEIPTTTTIGMEVMEEFSEHDSYDAGAQPSPRRAPVV